MFRLCEYLRARVLLRRGIIGNAIYFLIWRKTDGGFYWLESKQLDTLHRGVLVCSLMMCVVEYHNVTMVSIGLLALCTSVGIKYLIRRRSVLSAEDVALLRLRPYRP